MAAVSILSHARSWSSYTSDWSIRCQHLLHTYCQASSKCIFKCIFRVFIMCAIITKVDLNWLSKQDDQDVTAVWKVASEINLVQAIQHRNMFRKLTLHIKVPIFLPAQSNQYFGVQTLSWDNSLSAASHVCPKRCSWWSGKEEETCYQSQCLHKGIHTLNKMLRIPHPRSKSNEPCQQLLWGKSAQNGWKVCYQCLCKSLLLNASQTLQPSSNLSAAHPVSLLTIQCVADSLVAHYRTQQ